MDRKVQIVDATPKWEALLPMMFHTLECGTEEGKEAVRDEIRRLAKHVDSINEEVRNDE